VQVPPPADTTRVSVIVPTHQRYAALRRLLESLTEQTVPAGSFEVIVSVDGSTDGTVEMLAGFEAPFPLRTLAWPQRGRAAARNAAVDEARGEIVILVDDDMQVVPEFVERHLAHHPPGSRLCVLGAVPIEVNGASTRAARYAQAKFDDHLERLADPAHLELPQSFYTGNTSLRAEVLREVGGFDEAFTRYGNEDVELSLRLRAAGVSLRYDPRALARQEYGKDLTGLLRDAIAIGSTETLLARKHPDVIAALGLANPNDHSRPWLAARAILLSLTRRWARTSSLVFGFAAILERLGLWRQPLFYRALRDYAFWVGADAEIGDGDSSELKRLAAELHRGPIDLLLHR
jgi:glycosyltransferase involved in cell wall biosynthesis